MLGVPWLYPTEINSLPMRTKGAAVATATNWITNFVIVEIPPIGIQSLGWRFWIVWTVFNAAFMPVIYFLYPETSNRSLEGKFAANDWEEAIRTLTMIHHRSRYVLSRELGAYCYQRSGRHLRPPPIQVHRGREHGDREDRRGEEQRVCEHQRCRSVGEGLTGSMTACWRWRGLDFAIDKKRYYALLTSLHCLDEDQQL